MRLTIQGGCGREQHQRDMRNANEVMNRMQREDPAAWREYVSELRSFEAGAACDGLSAAASDWPEYNGDGTGTSALPSG